MALSTSAQTQYEKGMNKAYELWSQNKTSEAINLFERISKAEKDNWLPSFYAGYITILSSFSIKDETTLTSKLNKAKSFLNNAASISPNNPEILIVQALHNTAYINFDGQKYGMTMSGKNSAIYEKALQIVPKKPKSNLKKSRMGYRCSTVFWKIYRALL